MSTIAPTDQTRAVLDPGVIDERSAHDISHRYTLGRGPLLGRDPHFIGDPYPTHLRGRAVTGALVRCGHAHSSVIVMPHR